MQIGFELQPETAELSGEDERRLRALVGVGWKPLVKVRFPDRGLYWRLRAVVPGVRVLTRPATEGYTARDMVGGYVEHRAALDSAGLLDRWVGHELSNEPNHTAGPYGGADGAERYDLELNDALSALYAQGDRPGALISPGLQPYNGAERWETVCGQRFDECDYRGGHAYWDRAAYVLDGCWQAVRYGRKPKIVTEIGDSSGADAEVKARRIGVGLRWLGEPDRNVKATIVFLLSSSNPVWQRYALPVEFQAGLAL